MTEKILFESKVCGCFLIENFDYEVVEILIEDGGYYYNGDTIVKFKTISRNNIEIKIPFSGSVINVFIKVGANIRVNQAICEVEHESTIENFEIKAFEYNKYKLADTEISMLTDDFTNEKSILFTKVAGFEEKYFKTFVADDFGFLFFGITFENYNGFVYAKFLSIDSDFPLSKNDTIILLFENEIRISYRFENKPSGQKSYHTNFKPLTAEDLKIFATANFLKLKITNERKNIYSVYHPRISEYNSQYKSEIGAQFLLKYMTACFIKAHIKNNLSLPTS